MEEEQQRTADVQVRPPIFKAPYNTHEWTWLCKVTPAIFLFSLLLSSLELSDDKVYEL